MKNSLVMETGPKPDGAVIWLHGLGASGHDFEPAVPALNLPQSADIRFIFPNAPSIPITVNGGMVMPAWYDILDMSIDRNVDEDQLRASAKRVHQIIDELRQGSISSERIVIAGFSQGGAVAYEAALTYPHQLCGLMTMSSYFASAKSIDPHSANYKLPVTVYHGAHDPVVSESLGQEAARILQVMGHESRYVTYPMQHTLCLEQIQDIGKTLRDWLSLGS